MYKFSFTLIILAMLCSCNGGAGYSLIEYTIVADVPLEENFETIEDGIYSNFLVHPEIEALFFDNQVDYDTFYQTLINGSSATQIIDFGLYRVIAMVDKAHITGGYSVEITEITLDSGTDYTIKVRFRRPLVHHEVSKTRTKPYHIIKVPIL